MRRALPALVATALGIAASGCGGGAIYAGAPKHPTNTPPPPPAAIAPGGVPIPGGAGHLTAQLRASTPVRARPGGPILARMPVKTSFGSPTIVPVLRREGSWLAVDTAALPNGKTGWIPIKGPILFRVRTELRVSVGRRQVELLRDGRVVQRLSVAVGRPANPTPLGRFGVTDKLREKPYSPAYGCCVLALSAHQPNVAQGWGGGDRIALHATPAVETVGHPVSGGCLRGRDADVARLVRTVPLGTPVLIGA